MNIVQEFQVQSPADRVWEFFQDIEEVAKCLPGAELLGVREDGAYEGKVGVRLGPMTTSFEGVATVTADAPGRTGRIVGSGADRRGGSRGKVDVSYALFDEGTATRVAVDAEVQISGPAAQFGRVGLINEMSSRLIDEFLACLESKLATPDKAAAAAIGAAPVEGGTLFLSSIWAIFLRFLRRVLRREPG